MQFRFFRPSRPFKSNARRDALILSIASGATWLVIQQTETCTRFFQYVAAHPHMELDSIILAGMFSTIGLLVFSLRRWSETARSERRYDELAHHDALTGLPNRRSFMEALNAAAMKGDNFPFACVLFDLDSFKQVNDLRGHFVGDQLLEVLAKDLRAALPTDVFVARIGGDEFGLLLSMNAPGRAVEVADLLVRVINEPRMIDGQISRVGVSVGIARYPADSDQSSSILRKADTALYRAKGQGNSIQVFEPDMEAIDQRYALVVAALRDAIPRGEILPHYQPLVDFGTDDVIGYEVLARWNSPVIGPVTPSEFIPAASQAGLTSSLCYRLFERACLEAAQWPRPLRISFNVTPRQLCDPLLAIKFLSILSKSGLSPHRLDIEMTEDALLEDAETARLNLETLKRVGVTLTLDDFGTGYSSLHHLRMLPFDKVKIDRSYIGRIVSSSKSRHMVEAIIKLIHALGLPALAEGVETEDVADMLREMGCDFGQGWLFGKPAPNGDILRDMTESEQLLQSGRMA